MSPDILYGELGINSPLITLSWTGNIRAWHTRLRLLTPCFTAHGQINEAVVPYSWPLIVQLANDFPDEWQPGPKLRAQILADLILRMPNQPREFPLELPPNLVPRQYQLDAAYAIAQSARMLLLDEPGTGKTVTTLLGLRMWAARNKLLLPRILVVCPRSVVDSWVDIAVRWCPNWRVVAWRGTPKQRENLLDTGDIYVTSYETARIDTDSSAEPPLRELKPHVVVADECQALKNPHSGRSMAVRRLAKMAKGFIALSGTPITHHAGDLWPTLQALEPLAFSSRARWLNRYCIVVPGLYQDEILGLKPTHEPEYREVLLGRTRRITKAEVLPQLPPKIYETYFVDLPTRYKKQYKAMEKDMLAEVSDPENPPVVLTVLEQLIRLSQMACAPTDLKTTREIQPDGTVKTHTTGTMHGPSWKVDVLLEILEERPDASVLVFAPSRQLIRLAYDYLHDVQIPTGLLVGGQTVTARAHAVQRFQNGLDRVLCATTGAGGVGLTLTKASTVVFLQRPWSLVESSQAEDRAHRIGSEQHEAIEIIDVIAKDTIDSYVRDVLKGKAGHLAELIQDPQILTRLLGGK